MIDGVIFDMDGTMFDTERMWATFWEPALAALGLPYREGLGDGGRDHPQRGAAVLRPRLRRGGHRGQPAPGGG